MKIFGFKPARFKQWLAVVRLEREHVPLPKLLFDMAGTALKGLPHLRRNKKLWRKRMRTCRRCPIYDPILRRCRPPRPPDIPHGPYPGSAIGCGCYTPFISLVKKQCYATDHGLEFGW